MIRINKLLSQLGIASRRKTEKMILDKEIFVNNKIATLGQKINLNDKVKIKGKIIDTNLDNIKKKYYLLNKPKQTVCTLKDNFNRTIVTKLINDNDYLFPVGRLDYNTTGILLITNDGELSNKLIHPSSKIKRVYRTRLDSSLNLNELKFLNGNSVFINSKISLQCVKQVEKQSYLITISQGSYHHIKKIFELVNKKVIDLKRIEFASLTCEKLMVGQYRKLKINEIKKLKLLVNVK